MGTGLFFRWIECRLLRGVFGGTAVVSGLAVELNFVQARRKTSDSREAPFHTALDEKAQIALSADVKMELKFKST